MQSTKGNKRFQLGLFAVLIASIVGQWQRVLEWSDGLPPLAQFFIGTAAVFVLMVLLAYILTPYLHTLLTLLTL